MKIFNLILFFILTAFTLIGQKNKGTLRILGDGMTSGNPGYIVSLHDPNSVYIGVGVILDSRTIVTAAHVVDNYSSSCTNCVSVRAGSQSISGSTQQTTSSSIILHPDYSIFQAGNPLSNAANDLAIIKLEEEFEFNGDVNKIDFARSCVFNGSNFSIGTPVSIYGWGGSNLNSQNNSNVLKKANANIFDLVGSQFWQDESFYQEQYNINSMFTIYSETSQAYFGDSGGPCIIDLNGSKYLAGIISWGVDPNKSSNSDILYPSIMADVFKMKEFILDNLESGTYACDIDGPILDEYVASLACGETVFDLNGLYSDPVPSGFEFRWSLDNYPLDCVTPVTNGLVTESGVYYAYYYNLDSDCYSLPSAPVMISLGCTSMNNLIVDSSMELDSDQTFNSIEIRNGATLKIENNVRIEIIDKVTVGPSSKLLVDGGILTNCPTCPKWQGIEIEGLDYSVSGWGTGGEVEIRNGGTVEYAKIGVNKVNKVTNSPIFAWDYGANVGNLILSSGAKIQNCDIGVQLNSIGFFFFGAYGETSTIDDAFFIENEIAIDLNFNNGLTINRNYFENNEIGVEVTNSSVNIYDNSFLDTQTGIMINAYYPSVLGVNIERNAFIGGYAIDTQSLNNAEYLVINQNVCVGSIINTYGISDFNITANDIIDCAVGLEHSSTGSYNSNNVISNSFINDGTGINVDGINNVEFLTNCFEDINSANIGIGYGSSIDFEQGNSQDEAGNCFDSGPRLVTMDSNEDLSFNYRKWPVNTPNTNWDCKDPDHNTVQNYTVVDAEEEVNESCGSGVLIYGPYPNFPIGYRDCQDYIDRNQNEIPSLMYLVNSLEEEIARLEMEVDDGNLNKWIAKMLISNYLECIDRAKKYIVTSLLHSQGGDTRKDAIKYLTTDRDFRFQIMAYSLMVSGYEYDRALEYLNSLSPVREDQLDFIDVQRIYLSYLSERSSFTLSNYDQNFIKEAGLKRLPLAGFARKIYHELTNERIVLDVPIYYNSTESGKRTPTERKSLIKVYPNPSYLNDDLNVFIPETGTKRCDYKIRVFNMRNEQISELTVVSGHHKISLPDVSGLMFFTIEKERQIIHSQRILRI